ncbi:MAG: hypothetical protein Q4D41_00345 [Prevotellaceae bacterium]|nr:hypothetical protein [Prevotellaceae bacterium]
MGTMWEIIKDIISFIKSSIAKRKSSFEASIKRQIVINAKGQQRSQYTLVLMNIGKGRARDIEISSDDILYIHNAKFETVAAGMTVQSPITLVTSNPNSNFKIAVQWNDGRKRMQKETIIANIEY